MASQPRNYLSPREYLEIERRSEVKSEYYLGEMFAMSGASRAHSLIAGNVTRLIGNKFEGRNCEVHGSDLRVKVAPTGLYTYPDASAFCGEGEFEDGHIDTLLNPQLIVEVLSPSTEAYDRGAKFAHYRKIPSLQEYVLISQDRTRVERFRRFEGDEWLFRIYLESDDVIELQSVDVSLRTSEVYNRVQFETAQEHPTTPQEEE